MESRSDSKRLAKNTLLLYARTLIMMFIGFYTSRVILNALGIENYGINNVVSGFIAMFSIVSGTLTATTQRYLTCEIGKENGNPKKMFGVAMNIHIILAMILFVLFETIGVYLLNHGLNIPKERMYAANWVFQFAILSTLIGIINSPYIGTIIAHERMGTFAYFSLYDCISKLLIVYLLYVTPFDRLITYSVFYFIVGFISTLMYNYYCRKQFPEAKFSVVRDRKIYKEMFSFAGMNFIGAFASLLSMQGTGILINIFYGVTLNAAQGIATQVQGLSTKFVGDFSTALKPQITKEYANGNPMRSMELALRGSKFSYFLTLLLACPILVNTPYILEFWLKIYPPEAVVFTRLMIVYTMLVLLSDSLVTVILATGNLTSTTWWIGGVRLMILPISYVALKLTDLPYMVVVVQIVLEIVSLFVRLKILNVLTHIDFISNFLKYVLSRISIVTLVGLGFALLMYFLLPSNFIGLILLFATSVVVTGLAILFLGLTSSEKSSVLTAIRNKLHKFNLC